jgi:hypothetical protein
LGGSDRYDRRSDTQGDWIDELLNNLNKAGQGCLSDAQDIIERMVI